MSTREQDIIKAFIEGKPVAKAAPKSSSHASAAVSAGRFGFNISAETMEQLEKRQVQTVELEKSRSGQDDGPVDKEAFRRDILGADRTRKLRAQASFRSENAGRAPASAIKRGGGQGRSLGPSRAR